MLNPEEITTCLALDDKQRYTQAMSYVLQRYAISKYTRYTHLKDIPITRKTG